MLLTFPEHAIGVTLKCQLLVNDGAQVLIFIHSLYCLTIYLKSRGAGARASEVCDHLLCFGDVQVQVIPLAPKC